MKKTFRNGTEELKERYWIDAISLTSRESNKKLFFQVKEIDTLLFQFHFVFKSSQKIPFLFQNFVHITQTFLQTHTTQFHLVTRIDSTLPQSENKKKLKEIAKKITSEEKIYIFCSNKTKELKRGELISLTLKRDWDKSEDQKMIDKSNLEKSSREEQIDPPKQEKCKLCLIFERVKEREECEGCISEGQCFGEDYLLLSIFERNQSYSIYKALHLPTCHLFLLKKYWIEKRCQKDLSIFEEMKKIDNLTRQNLFPLLSNLSINSSSLLSNKESLKNKFLVFEWNETASTLAHFSSNSFKMEKSNQDSFIMRMSLLLLNQLSFLHRSQYLHRSITPNSILFYQDQNDHFFIFSHFHSISPISQNKRKYLNNSTFNPPEFNTTAESYQSDVYSLASSILFFVRCNEIQISQPLLEILNKMKEGEISSRLTLSSSIEHLLLFSKQNNFTCDIASALVNNSIFRSPPLSSFEDQSWIENISSSHTHNPILLLKINYEKQISQLKQHYEKLLVEKDQKILFLQSNQNFENK